MENNNQQTVYGEIPSDWCIDNLKNVCVKDNGILTGPFGSQLHQRDYQSEGVPIITVEHLGENYLIHSDIPRVSDSDYERLSRYKLEAGDIVFSRVGSVDRRALVRDEENGWLFSGRCLRVRPNRKVVNPDFLSWFFGLPIFKDYIRKIAVGATMPSLNTTLLSNIEVILPPLAEQKAIANILSKLTNLSLLNEEMNRTLEAVGAALFRRWFVDFEFPNQEGKPYKTTGGKMQYNEELQMEIPENWTAKRVGDLAKINEHSINRDFSFSAIEYIDIDSVEQGLIKKRQLLTLKNAPSRAKRIVKDEDIIISTVRPNLKHFAFIQGAKANTIVSTGFAVISAKLTSPKLLYYHLTSDRYTNYLSAIADSHTSTYPSFNPDIIYNTLIAHPIEEKNGVMAKLILDFERLLSCVFQKIHNNNEQNSVLSMLRDALLPKLMSGKIRVPINKENVEMAVT